MACSLGPRCAFVVGLVTLSYRVAQWPSSASADGSIRVSSGHVRSHRQQQEPSQLEAPSWDSANSLQLTALPQCRPGMMEEPNGQAQ